MKKICIPVICCSLALTVACGKKVKETSANAESRMRQVEQSLEGVVPVEGEGKWTIEERMAFYKVKGLSIAVIDNFKIDWAKGYGFADAEEQRRVTTETLFQAASISKSLNGVGVLKLAQEGKVELGTDINTYLRSWKFPYDDVSNGKKITLANILSHTAGLTVHGFPGYQQGDSLPAIIEILNGTMPANSPAVRSKLEPGLRVEYSGGGTTISQCIVRDVTQLPYEEYMRTAVLEPIGMSGSFYNQPPPESRAALLATGYDYNGNVLNGKYHIYPEQAAAGLWTNPTDLAKYIIETQLSWAGESSKVLSKEYTQKRLTAIQGIAGLGVFLPTHGHDKYFEHGGSNAGFRSIYMGGIENGKGLVVMVNSDNDAILQEIVTSIANVYGWDGFQKTEPKKIVTLQPEQLQVLEGYYQLAGKKDAYLNFRVSGNQLILKQLWDGREVTFDPESDTEFFSRQFPFPLKFTKDAKGNAVQVLAFEKDIWNKVVNYDSTKSY
jgi:CubicO group peptidase (beta-lactamase class C family)